MPSQPEDNPITTPSPGPGTITGLRIVRAIAAIALLATGAIHLEQYTVAHYSVIPTIGPLFLLNFLAATALGLVLLVPVGASAGSVRQLIDTATALGGIGIAAGALAALLVSEHAPLFGFMEHGYRLEIVIAIVAETVAIVALVLVVALTRGRGRQARCRRLSPVAATGTATEP